MKVAWSRPALADFKRCEDFLSARDPDAAVRARAAILQGLQTLREQPRVGSPATSGPPSHRDWTIRFGGAGYIVRYRIDADALVIVRFRHMREAPFFKR